MVSVVTRSYRNGVHKIILDGFWVLLQIRWMRAIALLFEGQLRLDPPNVTLPQMFQP